VPRAQGCARAAKENNLRYYEAVLPRLKPGGLLAAGNTLWSGKVLDPKKKSNYAIAAFNSHVARIVVSTRFC
jgi:caffeoyl-CoA O-methyltransferase